jgi:hypothetical protein
MKRKRVNDCLLLSVIPVNDVIVDFLTMQDLLWVGKTGTVFYECFYRKHFNARVTWMEQDFVKLRNKSVVRHLCGGNNECILPQRIQSLETHAKNLDFARFTHLVRLIKLPRQIAVKLATRFD